VEVNTSATSPARSSTFAKGLSQFSQIFGRWVFSLNSSLPVALQKVQNWKIVSMIFAGDSVCFFPQTQSLSLIIG
jgi:hypothetical protein